MKEGGEHCCCFFFVSVVVIQSKPQRHWGRDFSHRVWMRDGIIPFDRYRKRELHTSWADKNEENKAQSRAAETSAGLSKWWKEPEALEKTLPETANALRLFPAVVLTAKREYAQIKLQLHHKTNMSLKILAVVWIQKKKTKDKFKRIHLRC